MSVPITQFVLFFVVFSQPLHAADSPITFSQYLKMYLQSDESLGVRRELLAVAQGQAEVQSDVYQSQLTLTPAWSERETTTSTATSKTGWRSLTGKYQQNTPWGMALELEGSVGPSPTSTLSFSVTESIWKNAFGAATRLRRSAARASVEENSQALAVAVSDSCLQGGVLYLKAHKLEQQRQILENQLKLSRRALKLSERAYRKKLSRKIDILGARGDSLDIESRLTDVSDQFAASLVELFEPIAQKPPANLVLAAPQLKFPEYSFSEEDNPNVVQAKKAAKARQLEWEAERSNNRTAVNLGLSLARSDHAQTGVDRDDVVSVYLSMDWPVINKSLSASTAIAESRMKAAQHQVVQSREAQVVAFRSSQIELKKLKKQVSLTEKKLVIYRDRVQEAVKLLNAGRVEFSNYQAMREQLLSEEIRLTELKSSLWLSELSLAHAAGQLQENCGGLL